MTRPFRLFTMSAALALVLALVGAWMLNVPWPWVLGAGVVAALVLLRILAR